MARMGDIEAEIRRDWERIRGTALHITHASQAPAVWPVNVETTTAKENLMSLLDTIKNGVAEAESKLEGLDEEALATLKRVTANPETAAVLRDLDGLAQVVGLPAGVVSGVASGLTTVLGLYAQQASAPVAAQ